MAEFGDVTAVTPQGLAVVEGYDEPVHPLGLSDEQTAQFEKLKPLPAGYPKEAGESPEELMRQMPDKPVPAQASAASVSPIPKAAPPRLPIPYGTGPTVAEHEAMRASILDRDPLEFPKLSPETKLSPEQYSQIYRDILAHGRQAPTSPVYTEIRQPTTQGAGLPVATPMQEPEVDAPPGLAEGGETGGTKLSDDSTTSAIPADNESDAYPKPVLMAYATHVAQSHDIPVARFLGQIAHESRWNPTAKGPSQDVGISQFIPSTAKQYGLIDDTGDHRTDPLQSLEAHGQYLADLHKQVGGDQKDPNWDNAFEAFNTGKNGLATKDPRRTYLAAVDAEAKRYGGVQTQESGGEALADTAQNPPPAPDPEIAAQFPDIYPQPVAQTEEQRQAANNEALEQSYPTPSNAPGAVTDIYGRTIPAGEPGSSISPQQGASPQEDTASPLQPPPVDTNPPSGEDFENYAPSPEAQADTQLQNATDLQQRGIDADANVATQLGQARQKTAQQGADAFTQLLQQQQASQKAAYDTASQKMNQYENAIKQVGAMKVDPKQWWSSNNGANRALGFLGILVSSFSGQQQNAALQQINKEVEQDVDAQKANISNAQHTAAGFHNVFEMAQSITKQDDASRLLAASFLKDQLAQQGAAQEAALMGPAAAAQGLMKSGLLHQGALMDKLKAHALLYSNEVGRNDAALSTMNYGTQALAHDALSMIQQGRDPSPAEKSALLQTTPANNRIQTDKGIVLTRNALTQKQKEQLPHIAVAKQTLARLQRVAQMGLAGKIDPRVAGQVAGDRLGFESTFGPATGSEFALSSRTRDLWDQAFKNPASLNPAQWSEVKSNLDAFQSQLNDAEQSLLGSAIPVATIR